MNKLIFVENLRGHVPQYPTASDATEHGDLKFNASMSHLVLIKDNFPKCFAGHFNNTDFVMISVAWHVAWLYCCSSKCWQRPGREIP